MCEIVQILKTMMDEEKYQIHARVTYVINNTELSSVNKIDHLTWPRHHASIAAPSASKTRKVDKYDRRIYRLLISIERAVECHVSTRVPFSAHTQPSTFAQPWLPLGKFTNWRFPLPFTTLVHEIAEDAETERGERSGT